MAPRRDGPRSARDGSWTSEDDDVVEEAELHGVALGRSASGHLNKGGGHPGGASHQTPRDETRRNMRALRKGGGGREDDTSTPRSRSRSRSRRAGPRGRGDVPEDLEPSPALAVDPQVMRKIQSDLDKLARKKNERERAKQRRGAREAKDHDRSASRLSGAGVRENILHTPLAIALLTLVLQTRAQIVCNVISEPGDNVVMNMIYVPESSVDSYTSFEVPWLVCDDNRLTDSSQLAY